MDHQKIIENDDDRNFLDDDGKNVEKYHFVIPPNYPKEDEMFRYFEYICLIFDKNTKTFYYFYLFSLIVYIL